MTAALIVLLSSSFGLSLAMTSTVIKRKGTWIEYLGLLSGILGGVALIVVGFVGAWMLVRDLLISR
jgi:hypothetical protein